MGKSPTTEGKKICHLWEEWWGECVDMMWKRSQNCAGKFFLIQKITWLLFPRIFNILNLRGKISHHGWKENLPSQRGMMRWVCGYDVKTILTWLFPPKLRRKFFLIQKTTLLFWPHIFNILNLRGKISHHGWKENLPSLRGMMGWVCGYDVKTSSAWFFPGLFF